MFERRHLEEEVLLHRRRDDLQNALSNLMKGPDASTETERVELTCSDMSSYHLVSELIRCKLTSVFSLSWTLQ